jgi:predicted porin
MNKKLIAAAIAAAVAAPTAALANDVTIYGVVHASLDYRTDEYTIRGTWDPADAFFGPFSGSVSDQGAIDGFDMASRATRIGFKGTEDLANGLKAIWKIEAQADIADRGGDCSVNNLGFAGYTGNSPTVNQGTAGSQMGVAGMRNTFRGTTAATVDFIEDTLNGTWTGTLEDRIDAYGALQAAAYGGTDARCDTGSWWTARNAYIGLAGGWGTFLMGRHDTPYKMSTGKLDLFADTLADYNSTIGMVDIRTNSAIAYVSPSFAGFSFSGALVTPHTYSRNTITGDIADADSLAGAYSVALNYDANGFFGALAYEVLTGEWIESWASTTGAASLAGADLPDNEKLRVGLGWTGMGFTVGGVYEWEDNMVGFLDSEGADGERWQLSAGYTFGNTTIKAMYGQSDYSTNWAYFAAPFDGSGPRDVYVDGRDRIDGDSSAWAIGLDHALSKRTKAYLLYTNVDYENNYASDLGLFDSDTDELLDSGRAMNGKQDGNAGGWSLGLIHNF